MTNAYTFEIKWTLDNKEIEIRIEPRYYHYLKIYRPNDFLNLATAHEVLNYPNRVFTGLNRLHSDSSKRLCVVGKPKYWNVGKKIGDTAPFPQNLVYLVFLNERKSIFEFRAEEADTEDTLSPVGWKDRFGELIWKMHS